ncbi:MAG: hypothetical protein JXQ65_04320 [Candidatus Marinimicrobia bacterium]|nr:hypothetical protein [Candidatus Neomarinimicrobiota bacterium]
MQSFDNNEHDAIDLLEAKVNELLGAFRELKTENKEYKEQLLSGQTTKMILDSAKRKQLRKKIENLLEYLEDF